MLRLPDLPPIYCRLCWTDAYHAGVTFELPLTKQELREWVESRAKSNAVNEAECAEVDDRCEAANDCG